MIVGDNASFLSKRGIPWSENIFTSRCSQNGFARKDMGKKVIMPPNIAFVTWHRGAFEFRKKQVIHTDFFRERTLLNKFLHVYHITAINSVTLPCDQSLHVLYRPWRTSPEKN
jgi:hypothetical protein